MLNVKSKVGNKEVIDSGLVYSNDGEKISIIIKEDDEEKPLIINFDFYPYEEREDIIEFEELDEEINAKIFEKGPNTTYAIQSAEFGFTDNGEPLLISLEFHHIVEEFRKIEYIIIKGDKEKEEGDG